MIRACQVYISRQGTASIWSQPRPEVRVKIQHCLKLHATYRSAYQKTKVGSGVVKKRLSGDAARDMYCKVEMRLLGNQSPSLSPAIENVPFHSIRILSIFLLHNYHIIPL